MVRTPQAGQTPLLEDPAPTASGKEVGHDNFRFRWVKGKRNVNRGPGEWSSGNTGYRSVVEVGGSWGKTRLVGLGVTGVRSFRSRSPSWYSRPGREERKVADFAPCADGARGRGGTLSSRVTSWAAL
ncbi:unnamed protein product [Rangifer tarandus platyrhynchus]|uniref:Uncharacterized protein n=1 Tax=Rangifer tarandus platyrhynchus TaxID=3082113 RepID=A0AC59YEP1_RANTA